MRLTPDDNMAYPLLIELSSGVSGSGFFMNTKDKVYLITAKHLLFNASILTSKKVKVTCQSRDINDDSVHVYTIDLEILKSEGNVYCHKTNDVAALLFSRIVPDTLEGYDIEYLSGVTKEAAGNGPLISVSGDITVKLINQVFISNDVYLYGYPSSIGLKNSPQFDYLKPLLRKGVIASINKKLGTIILDCPVYYGNSGGPVIQVVQLENSNRFDVIGVVSEFIPFYEYWKNLTNGLTNVQASNSGYSVAVSMDSVFEMIGYTPDLS